MYTQALLDLQFSTCMPTPDALADIAATARASLTPSERKKFGAYLTPAPLARQITRMCMTSPSRVMLGDHGAGSGFLSCLTASMMLSRADRPREVNIGAYEVQSKLHKAIRQSLGLVSSQAEAFGADFTAQLSGDFLEGLEDMLAGRKRELTHSVLNPPYFKIGPKHPANITLKNTLGFTVPNVYALFIVATLMMLKEGGEMVALIPRSFASGIYYKPFRKFLIENANLTHIVRFSSRSNLFKEDNVLQENCVIRCIAGHGQQSRVQLDFWETPESGCVNTMSAAAELIVSEDCIAMPATDGEMSALRTVRGQGSSFENAGFEVGTGRCVLHKVSKHFSYTHSPAVAPHIHAKMFRSGEPVDFTSRSYRGPSGVNICSETETFLNDAGRYLLIKRVSPNDGMNQRVASTMFDSRPYHGSKLAISNGLQVVSSRAETVNSQTRHLSALQEYLTSAQVQDYIRAVNGTTQINKADLLGMGIPTSLNKL